MMPFFAIDTECGDENSRYFKRNLANTTANTNTTATATTSMSYVKSTPSTIRDNLTDIPIGYHRHTFCHFSNESN